MKNILFLIVLFSLNYTTRAEELYKTVVPIQWQKFKQVKPGKEYLLSS